MLRGGCLTLDGIPQIASAEDRPREIDEVCRRGQRFEDHLANADADEVGCRVDGEVSPSSFEGHWCLGSRVLRTDSHRVLIEENRHLAGISHARHVFYGLPTVNLVTGLLIENVTTCLIVTPCSRYASVNWSGPASRSYNRPRRLIGEYGSLQFARWPASGSSDSRVMSGGSAASS